MPSTQAGLGLLRQVGQLSLVQLRGVGVRGWGWLGGGGGGVCVGGWVIGCVCVGWGGVGGGHGLPGVVRQRVACAGHGSRHSWAAGAGPLWVQQGCSSAGRAPLGAAAPAGRTPAAPQTAPPRSPPAAPRLWECPLPPWSAARMCWMPKWLWPAARGAGRQGRLKRGSAPHRRRCSSESQQLHRKRPRDHPAGCPQCVRLNQLRFRLLLIA